MFVYFVRFVLLKGEALRRLAAEIEKIVHPAKAKRKAKRKVKTARPKAGNVLPFVAAAS